MAQWVNTQIGPRFVVNIQPISFPSLVFTLKTSNHIPITQNRCNVHSRWLQIFGFWPFKHGVVTKRKSTPTLAILTVNLWLYVFLYRFFHIYLSVYLTTYIFLCISVFVIFFTYARLWNLLQVSFKVFFPMYFSLYVFGVFLSM